MPRIEEESVTRIAAGLLGVVAQIFGKEQIDEIGSTHSSTRVTALGAFHHSYGEGADIISGTLQ